MTKFFRDFVRDESGAAAAEYALILAIVGAGIAGAAFFLGGEVSKGMTGAGNKICAVPAGGTTSIC
ncbi:Flp family type IVb pilin [Novosphingobium aquiterrae]|uniref:Flp family type IVb pilin n=1 Tax=Novosphingobium aquiterrae TaxID=624388 RepID=A0ABV6PKL8_9SPHN